MLNREIIWGSNSRLGNLEAHCLSLGLGIHFEVASNALQLRGWMMMVVMMMVMVTISVDKMMMMITMGVAKMMTNISGN